MREYKKVCNRTREPERENKKVISMQRNMEKEF